MIILKSIGAFFVKIWRWIKETAWVQPLLIVGAIFGIIFSIPYITKYFESLNSGTSSSVYLNAKVTLQGEGYGNDRELSPVDKLTNSVIKGSTFSGISETGSKEAAAEYGEKFFLVYVGESCTQCATDAPGFSTLSDLWKESYVPTDGRDLKMYTIFSDETSSNDSDYEGKDYDTAFKRYLYNYTDSFFLEAGQQLYDAPYRLNKSIADADYETFWNAGTEGDTSFKTPTVLLVDFSKEAADLGRCGVSEVIFNSLSGSDSYAKAQQLCDMWNHTDKSTTNPFSESYKNI